MVVVGGSVVMGSRLSPSASQSCILSMLSWEGMWARVASASAASARATARADPTISLDGREPTDECTGEPCLAFPRFSDKGYEVELRAGHSTSTPRLAKINIDTHTYRSLCLIRANIAPISTRIRRMLIPEFRTQSKGNLG